MLLEHNQNNRNCNERHSRVPFSSSAITPPIPPSFLKSATTFFAASVTDSSRCLTLEHRIVAVALLIKYWGPVSQVRGIRSTDITVSSPTDTHGSMLCHLLDPKEPTHCRLDAFLRNRPLFRPESEPIGGVSPIRPTSLFVFPPILVTAAMHPSMSSATAPTVP